MAVYTVHLPSQGFRESGRASLSAPQAALADAIFLPEGFSRAAFFLGPFWLAWHRLWLILVIWLVVFGLLVSLALRLVESGTSFLVGFLLQALLGLEGNDLRRGELARRGYRLVDVAAGATLEDAERSFYRRSFETSAIPPALPQESAQPKIFASNPHAEVLGLFPLPEDRR
jgi:hypothetical protein